MASHEAPTNNGQIGGAVADNVPKDTEQQASSTGQLLQLAQAASGSVIQIPAGVFTSLLQSLSGLQSSITKLNIEVQELRDAQSQANHNVQKLQLHSGMDFALFPKLPPEVQRIIWGHCANVSRVVVLKTMVESDPINWVFVPTALRCQLFAVCKEARSEASKIILPLEHISIYCLENANVPKIFLNPATDIVWLTSSIQKHRPYDGVEGLLEYHIEGKPHQKVATKVALPYAYWHGEMANRMEDAVVGLWALGTEEVILVVGDESASKSPDIVFVEPKETPKSTLGSKFLGKNGFLNEDITWEEMNEAEMKYLTACQTKRAVPRRQYFLSKSRSLSTGGRPS
jgi:hypothetical protein